MRKYGIIDMSVVPVRKEPSHRSEMVTELMFGDTFTVVDQVMHWYKVQGWWDGYEGWLDEPYICFISKERFETLQKAPLYILDKKTLAVPPGTEAETIWVPEGARLPDWDERQHTCHVGERVFTLPGTDVSVWRKRDRDYLTHYAQRFIGVPYLWGGSTSCGFDCSGFTQTVFRVCGYRLPRDASQQAKTGREVAFVKEARPGDLAFFGDEENKITHVGIVLGNGRILHESGDVHIDKLDQEGIFNLEHQVYTHTLRLIKDPFHE